MSDNEPMVTIGMPFYNCEGTLLNAARSIFAQTLQDWELIMADDGSTDGGLRLAQRIDDRRVRVLSDGRNRGLAARLNQIAEVAKGDYLIRMDADDLSAPNRIETLVSFLQGHPEVSVVGSAMLILGSDGLPCGKRVPWTEHEDVFSRCYSNVGIMHATVGASRAWFRSHPYDERLLRSEDYDLWMRSRSDSRFANLPDPLYFYTEHESFRMSNYVKGSCEVATVAWEHARRDLGFLRAVAYRAACYGKIGVYLVAQMLGVTEQLIRRRSDAITYDDMKFFDDAMETISKTDVPLRRAPALQGETVDEG